MKSWLRQHHYAFTVAVGRLIAQPFSSLTNIIVIALALSLPLIVWVLLLAAQPLVQHMPVATEITVYLQTDADKARSQAIQQQLQERYHDQVSAVELIDKDQAKMQLERDPTWADALSALPSNPLPHTLILRLKSHDNQSQQADDLANAIQEIDDVDNVQLDRDWLKRLDALLQFGRLSLLLLSLSVGLIMIAAVFNTIRLQSLNQRQEIAVARLVGATESFVRRPFLYVGAISGALSCLVAVLLSHVALTPLNTALNQLATSYDASLYLQLPQLGDLLVIALLVMCIAAFAARWSVTRHSAL